MATATAHVLPFRPTSLLSPRRAVGTLAGVGIELAQDRNWAVVRSIESGSSAAVSGVQIGDVVLTVDGRRVQGMPPQEIQLRLKGEPGTRVLAGLSRGSGPSAGRVYVSLVRGPVAARHAAAAAVPASSSHVPAQPAPLPRAEPILKGPVLVVPNRRESPADSGGLSQGNDTPTRSGQFPRVLALAVPAPVLGLHLEQAQLGGDIVVQRLGEGPARNSECIHQGDVMKSVDRKSTAGMTVADVYAALCATPGSAPADGSAADGELLLGLSRTTPEGRVQQFWVALPRPRAPLHLQTGAAQSPLQYQHQPRSLAPIADTAQHEAAANPPAVAAPKRTVSETVSLSFSTAPAHASLVSPEMPPSAGAPKTPRTSLPSRASQPSHAPSSPGGASVSADLVLVDGAGGEDGGEGGRAGGMREALRQIEERNEKLIQALQSPPSGARTPRGAGILASISNAFSGSARAGVEDTAASHQKMWETLHGSPAATAGAAGQRKGPSALPSGGGGDQTGGAREEARQNSPDVRSPATPRTPGVGVAQWMGVGASSGAKIQHLQARVDAKRSSLGSSLGETSVPHPPGHVAAMPSPRISSSGGVALPAAPLPAAAAAAGGGVAAAAPAGARPPPSGTPPLRGAGGINPDRPAVQSGPPRAVPLLNLAKVPPPWQALGDAPPTARARPAPAPAPLAPARGEAAPAAHQTRAETPRGAATPRGGAGNYFAAQQAPRQSGVASGQQASPQQALPQRASPQRAPLPWYLQPASEVSQAQAQARPPPQVAARPLRPEHQQHQHPQHQHHLQQQYQQQQQQRRHQSPQQQPSPGPGVAWHSPTQYLASPSHSLAAAPQHAAVPPHSVRVSGGTPQHYSGGTPPVHYSGHNSPADSAMRASLSTQASYTPRVQTPAGGQHHIPGILKTPRTSSAPSPASAAASAPTPVDYRGYATPPTPVDYRGYATPPAHSYGVMPAAAAATPRAAAAAHAQGRAGSMTPRAGLTTPLGGAPSGPVALTPRGGGASTPRARSAATVAYSVAVDAQADRITTPRQRPIPATEARSSYISFC